MPRRTEPKRDIKIGLDEESIRDAMALWIRTYHGIEIDAKKIEINAAEGGISASFIKKPEESQESGTVPPGP